MTNTHPINFVESLLVQNELIYQVQFSRYHYHPHSLTEESTPVVVSAGKLRDTFQDLEKRLRPDEDIAFDSVMRMRDKEITKCHFALLDFETSDLERIEFASKALIGEYGAKQAILVNSGRSYHLYMDVLLTHDAWVRFMGRALLLNTRDEPPTVDARWIGHRLIGGHAALRWSAKAKPFVPKVVRRFSGNQVPAERAEITAGRTHSRRLPP
jgi:hypothetical protein